MYGELVSSGVRLRDDLLPDANYLDAVPYEHFASHAFTTQGRAAAFEIDLSSDCLGLLTTKALCIGMPRDSRIVRFTYPVVVSSAFNCLFNSGSEGNSRISRPRMVVNGTKARSAVTKMAFFGICKTMIESPSRSHIRHFARASVFATSASSRSA